MTVATKSLEHVKNSHPKIDNKYNDELVVSNLKALYENGWFVGQVKYFQYKDLPLFCSF